MTNDLESIREWANGEDAGDYVELISTLNNLCDEIKALRDEVSAVKADNCKLRQNMTGPTGCHGLTGGK